jgi:hypothetical protein
MRHALPSGCSAQLEFTLVTALSKTLGVAEDINERIIAEALF